MIKWLILGAVALIVTVFVISIIRVMLKIEKDDSKPKHEKSTSNPSEQTELPINLHSSSAAAPVMDLTDKGEIKHEGGAYSPKMFNDELDDDFPDFSNFAHNSKGRRRPPVDFDLDGDLADEYIPSSPDFSYLPQRRANKSKPSLDNINELPTELKVLMLSDIFDRKFD